MIRIINGVELEVFEGESYRNPRPEPPILPSVTPRGSVRVSYMPAGGVYCEFTLLPEVSINLATTALQFRDDALGTRFPELVEIAERVLELCAPPKPKLRAVRGAPTKKGPRDDN